MSDAPNFSGTYPLDGERIGPAWRAAWRILAADPTRWHTSEDLAAVMTSVVEIADKTARNLLRQARAHGLLQVRHAPRRKTGQTHRATAYRIAS